VALRPPSALLLAGALIVTGLPGEPSEVRAAAPAHGVAEASAAPAQAADAITVFARAMRSLDGYVPVHLDPATGKIFLEIPEMDRDVLYLNALATGLGSARVFGLDAGQGGDDAVVRFHRRGPRVVMVRRNTTITTASGDEGQRWGVERTFPVSALASLPVVEEVEGRLLVGATEFLLSGVVDVRGTVRRAGPRTVSSVPEPAPAARRGRPGPFPARPCASAPTRCRRE